jgi:CDP-diacylglycerol--glycerol-3-phosphate 3-phosphatidyltransferase
VHDDAGEQADVRDDAAPPLKLRMEFLHEVWMRAETDGGEVFEGVYEPGQIERMQADEEIVLRLGVGGTIEFTLNGAWYGPLAHTAAGRSTCCAMRPTAVAWWSEERLVLRVPACHRQMGRQPIVSSSSDVRAFNAANAMTALRVVLVPIIVFLLLSDAETAWWWALVLFVIASFTDTADGWLARRQAQETRWGKLADPAADKILVLGVLATLVYVDEVAPWVLAVVAIREIAVTVQRQILLRQDLVMSASIWGKLKTVSQLTAISLVIAPVIPEVIGDAAIYLAVLLTVGSGLDYAVRGARRLREAA